MKVVMKKTKDNRINVNMTGFTLGQIMALKHALDQYAKVSPVAEDVQCFLQQEIDRHPDMKRLMGG